MTAPGPDAERAHPGPGPSTSAAGPRVARPALVTGLRAALRDPLVANSLIMLATTLTMAAAGTFFWIVVARVADPAQVGLASTLVTAAEALAFFAQLGLNVSLIRSMPRSDRPAADATTGAAWVALAGAVLAVGYCAVLPLLSPTLARVVPWLLVPLFALLVAGTAVNQLTDSVFLAVNRVRDNFVVNGAVLGLLRVVLPLGLTGAGAFMIFGVVGASSLVAAVLSLLVILRRLPDRPGLRPSVHFRGSRDLALAGYLTNCLLIAPQLLIPLIVINAVGPSGNAVFFISFQVVNLLNHAIYTVGNATYAEAERAPEHWQALMAKGGRTMALGVLVGGGLLLLLAPLLLAVFGAEYHAGGVGVLRILALGSAGVALNYWAAVRLRLARDGRAMVGVQLVTSALTVALAAWGAQHGLEGAAAGWGIGQLAGGAVGALLSLRLASSVDGSVGIDPEGAAPGPQSKEVAR